MGMFSWKTSDTKESIANIHSSRTVRPVFLLQPGGLPSIRETAYQGYGKFGGIDAYAWLAEQNFGDASLIAAAINADCGHYHEDDKAIYLCNMHISAVEFIKVVPGVSKPVVMFENYRSVLSDGTTPTSNIEKGLWTKKQLTLPYPLKFSFNSNARYEDLPPAESCEFQGYLYPDGDDA